MLTWTRSTATWSTWSLSASLDKRAFGVTINSIEMDPHKVSSIMDWPAPTSLKDEMDGRWGLISRGLTSQQSPNPNDDGRSTTKELQQFLSLANYYG
ncbi:hypothetical protein BC828DRAFT_410214 [Blastocladiella britannica]|nr:hypothetical protein BC828DRAFT_410214 [Blastocladiella britannica]